MSAITFAVSRSRWFHKSLATPPNTVRARLTSPPRIAKSCGVMMKVSPMRCASRHDLTADPVCLFPSEYSRVGGAA